jgi:3-methyladenine DNA glycosylase AlkD
MNKPSLESVTWTPEAVAGEAAKMIRRRADPVKARSAQRFFKEKVLLYGLTAGEIRDIAGELYRSVKDEWEVGEAVELSELLLRHEYFEPKSVGILILLRFKKDFGPEILALIKKWLARNLLDNWAAVDTLCPDAVGALLEKHPELVPEIRGWTGHPNRWVKRASAVSFIKLARRGKALDAAYDVSRSLFGVRDDLVQKASGWLLREAGKTDMGRLEKFILFCGPEIPRTTLRYAIERFPAEKRRRLLASTRTAKTKRNP